jgi:hypothetical protein
MSRQVRGSNRSVTYYLDETKDGDSIDPPRIFEIEAYVTKYTPGFLSGPPECCYEAEGGEATNIEVFEILQSGKVMAFTVGEFKEMIPGRVWKSIEYGLVEGV